MDNVNSRYEIKTFTTLENGLIKNLRVRIVDKQAQLSRYENELSIPAELIMEFYLRMMREHDKIEAYNNG